MREFNVRDFGKEMFLFGKMFCEEMFGNVFFPPPVRTVRGLPVPAGRRRGLAGLQRAETARGSSHEQGRDAAAAAGRVRPGHGPVGGQARPSGGDRKKLI